MFKTYTVYLYREARVTFQRIAAESYEDAARDAAARANYGAGVLERCDGRNLEADVRLADEPDLSGGAEILLEVGRLLDAAPEVLAALTQAERFIAGFEGDETQEGIDGLLHTIRMALLRAGADGDEEGSG